MNATTLSLTAVSLLAAASVAAQSLSISRAGSRAAQSAPPTTFTGTVQVETLFEAVEPSHTSGASVTFAAGARTFWHTHPRGQMLVITAGAGRVQRWGDPVEEVRAGDVVRIPAGQKHWHGASPASTMTHIAITEHKDGTRVEWLEPVSDAQYAGTDQGNPFSLVYGGAITKNEPGKVNIHPVSYELHGLTIAANVYTPPGHDPRKSYPAVVIAHPNGGVKEQVAGLYAQRLAELGYVTIAADAAHQGASGGEPRYVDTPANRVADIQGMADYLSRYAGVDAGRLGLLGICGGGGYSLTAAQRDKRFRSVATLSLFNSGRVRRNGFRDSQIDTISQRLRQASDARALEAAGGPVRYANDVRLTDDQIATLPFELYRQGMAYYLRTHAHPNSSARYTVSSLVDLMTFDATDHLDLLDQPLLMMVGGKADSAYMSEDAFARATGTQDKELFTIDGATHIETYWVPKHVDTAMHKLATFYGRTLVKTGTHD